MKRVFTILICICMLGAVVAGCAPAAPEAQPTTLPNGEVGATTTKPANLDAATTLADGTIINPAGVFPIVVSDEPYVMQIYMPVSEITVVEGNILLEYWEKMTNIKLDIIEASAEPTQQVNLMLASGENLPEVFCYGSMGMDRLSLYGSQGIFLPLNDLMDEWCVNVDAMWDYTAPYGKSSLTAQDGSLYAVPTFNGCFHCNYSQRGWINQRWLDELGLKMPTTTDEFYQVLKAFKDNDANGNGIADDEIPLIGTTDGWNSAPGNYIMSSFVTHARNTYRVNVVDGKVVPYYNQEGYKEGMRYLKKLYAEKLLDNDCFVMANAQASMLGTNPAGNQVGAFFSGVPTMLSAEGDIPFQYTAIPPLMGPDGVQSTFYVPDMPHGKVAITNKCKNPEVAVRWADSWLDTTPEMDVIKHGGATGDRTVAFVCDGTEGLLGMDGSPAVSYHNVVKLSAPDNKLWLFDANPFFLSHEMRARNASSLDSQGFDQEVVIYKAALEYEPFRPKEYFPPSIVLGLDELMEVNEIQTQINTYVDENFAAFVTGAKDIDIEWENYIKVLEKMGVSRVLELITHAWQTQYR